ncbi:MAG: hypothetical protein ACT4OZ_11200 [Gemmatimonadota bacterium]
MPIQNIRGPVDPNLKPGVGGANARVNERDRAPAVLDNRAPAARSRPAPAGAASVPVQPPPGTDPELWQVLTSDERAYFAKLGAMGPLTYGRVLSGQNNPAPAAARGVRLDVKA